jgi:hypothetical protein
MKKNSVKKQLSKIEESDESESDPVEVYSSSDT